MCDEHLAVKSAVFRVVNCQLESARRREKLDHDTVTSDSCREMSSDTNTNQSLNKVIFQSMHVTKTSSNGCIRLRLTSLQF